MANSNLANAKRAKNDEFYTQYGDIQKEIGAYLEYDPDSFRNKTVYCNCDDPYESNFFRYFVLNFNRLGLKRLITTSYKPSPVANTQLGLFGDDRTLAEKGRPKVNANKFVINEVCDTDGDGEFNLKDIAAQLKANKNNDWEPLEGDGDFRSDESIDLLKQSDIVVTNPPFSLFREFLKQLVDYQKEFLIIGNLNAITYKEVFPLLKENKIWLGNNYRINGGAMFFEIPEKIANLEQVREIRTDESGKKIFVTRVQGVRWFTNLDHGRRHQPIPLMIEAEVVKFATKKPFDKYDNFDAIEVPLIKNIPSDYIGLMGVPISIFDKYSPEQFEIVGYEKSCDLRTKIYPKQLQIDKTGKKSFVTKLNDGAAIRVSTPPDAMTYYVVDDAYYVQSFKRIFIRHKK
ncbi:adenine-specific methyltransferase EcoRI family protein [Candidatus Uhrbacteria bacterium]|nr:adenine-specific methyltransferase EcoRI family protein [Candidatus Uhrbacteria bacterium]